MPLNSLVIKMLNGLIFLSFAFLIIQSFKYYKRLSSIPCFGLQAPPENYALLGLIPYIGVMLLLPALLILIRYFIIKKNVTKK
jgi:hypothetical protein